MSQPQHLDYVLIFEVADLSPFPEHLGSCSPLNNFCAIGKINNNLFLSFGILFNFYIPFVNAEEYRDSITQ